jgi:uncharacterized membrane protein
LEQKSVLDSPKNFQQQKTKFRRFQKLASLFIFAVAGLCVAAAVFYAIRFYTTPALNIANFPNEMAWFNYSLWRGSLIPTSNAFLAAAFVTSLLALSVFPLSSGKRKVFTIFMLSFLEEQLAVWGSWLYSHIPLVTSLWRYDPFPLLYWVMAGSVAICFVIMAAAALVTVQISFKSIPRTFQIMSLSLVPLPLYVYFFDRGEFFIHFQDAVSVLSFVTNEDLLFACVGVFCLATVFQSFRKLHSRN